MTSMPPELAAPERLPAAGIADMTELARAACVRYGISPEARLHQYPLTENWTYRVEDGSGAPAVLRVYRPGGRSHEEIRSELAWMTAIGEEFGALVPAVIPTAAGSQVLEVSRDASRGPCYCVMFSCAPGQEPAEDRLAAWSPQLGAITARLHQQAADVHEQAARLHEEHAAHVPADAEKHLRAAAQERAAAQRDRDAAVRQRQDADNENDFREHKGG